MNVPATASLLTSLLAVPVAAQQTWVVSMAGGPGVHFNDLPPAVAAASAGDTILLAETGGVPYSATTFDKGITVLGAGVFAAVEQLTIENLPAGETLVLHTVSATYGFGTTGNPLHVRNCPGTVVLENVQHAVGIGSVHVRIDNCDQVLLRRCQIAGIVAPNRIHDSRVIADDCTFSSALMHQGSALELVRSELTLTSCEVYAQPSAFSSAVAVEAHRSALTLVDTDLSVLAFAPPPFLIEATCTTPPSTVTQPASQSTAPALVGSCGAQVFTDVPSLSASDLVQQLAGSVQVLGAVGDTAYLFVGLPGGVPNSTALGEVWLTPSAYVFVATATIGASGAATVALPVLPVAVPVGATFVWQAATVTATSSLVVTPPSFATVR